LVAEGCDTTLKLLAELDRLGRLRMGSKPWNIVELDHYLKRHLPGLFEKIRVRRPRSAVAVGPRPDRSAEIKRAFDGIRRQGIAKAVLIAERLNRQGILPPSGPGTWTAQTVYDLCKRLGRHLKQPAFWNEARVAQALAFYRQGRSYRDIAWELGNEERRLSRGEVNAIVLKARRAAGERI
jgi:hypothetical protein